jgi:chemotaxis signal transduction protein
VGAAIARAGTVGEAETVVFRLGACSFAMDASLVQQVCRVRRVVPCAREGASILGLVKVKGRTLPLYDFASILGARRSKETPKARLVVAEGPHGPYAFVVDEVVLPAKALVDTRLI